MGCIGSFCFQNKHYLLLHLLSRYAWLNKSIARNELFTVYSHVYWQTIFRKMSVVTILDRWLRGRSYVWRSPGIG